MSDKFVVNFRNSFVNVDNYQLVDLNTAVGGSPGEPVISAQLGLYFWNLMDNDLIAAGTSMHGINYRASGSSGGVDVPFPGANQTAAIAAAAAAGFTITGPSDYDDAGGAGDLAPLGTSISVSEVTATSGPTGRGRHFLPFISVLAVDTGGTLVGAGTPIIKTAWELLIRGRNPTTLVPISGLFDLQPVVSNAANTTNHPITLIKPQPVFSNLESRRR